MGDWQRIVVAVLGSIAFVLLLSNTWRNWAHFGPRARLVVTSLLLLTATGVFGVVEARARSVPVMVTTYLLAGTYFIIIIAFTAVRSQPTRRRS